MARPCSPRHAVNRSVPPRDDRSGRLGPSHHQREPAHDPAPRRAHALAHPPLSPTDTKNLCYSLLTEAQKKKFEEQLELDFSFGIKGVSRFRGNLFSRRARSAAPSA
jgi:hypothetical protein